MKQTIFILALALFASVSTAAPKQLPYKKAEKIFQKIAKATFTKGKKGEKKFKNQLRRLTKLLKQKKVFSLPPACTLQPNGPNEVEAEYVLSCIGDAEVKNSSGETTNAMFLIKAKCDATLCSNGQLKAKYKGEVNNVKIQVIDLNFDKKTLAENRHFVEIKIVD